MSRAFAKEDDQEEAPFIPPRAPLPAGLTNYITPTGLQLLQQEQKSLEKEKELAYQLDNEYNRRREVATINGKLKLLQERIYSSRLLRPQDQANVDEVRFGAIVKLTVDSKSQVFQLVGVDEADASKGKIAFSAPIATAIMGYKAGDSKNWPLGKEVRKIEILSVHY